MSPDEVTELIELLSDLRDLPWVGIVAVVAVTALALILLPLGFIMLVVRALRRATGETSREPVILRSDRRCVTVVRRSLHRQRSTSPMRLVLTETALLLTTPSVYRRIDLQDLRYVEAWGEGGVLRLTNYRPGDDWSQIVVPVGEPAPWLAELGARGARVRGVTTGHSILL